MNRQRFKPLGQDIHDPFTALKTAPHNQCG